ncbi:glycerol kinase [Flagelloscypha sp. PMI_526]|nr:glycerol kinase [Flagelloscypha sp. PMI_526]
MARDSKFQSELFPSSMSLKQGEFIGSLDCGTTSIRFIIFDKHASIVAQHQLEFPQYYPNPGWHDHDPMEIQEYSDKCIEEAVKSLESLGWSKDSIKVIGITNQRETCVAFSRKTGKPLCRAIVWTDSRTKNTAKHYSNLLETHGLEIEPGVWKKGPAALTDITGIPISTYFTAIKLRWMIDHYPEVHTAHEEDDLLFGTVESWIVYNLLGGVKAGIHICEVSNASRTLLLNLKTLKWESSLLKFFGLRESILPRLVSTSEVYGKIAYGALSGVPIGGLVGDQQAALLGNKCFTKGEAKCTYGTGGFPPFLYWDRHRLEHTRSVKHGISVTLSHAKPVYALEGSIGAAGSVIKWLRDSLGFIKEAADINALAREEPTSGGLVFVTCFLWSSGSLLGFWCGWYPHRYCHCFLTVYEIQQHSTRLRLGISQYTNRSHIARAALEANAFQTRAIIESMKKDSGSELKQLKVDGGMTNGDIVMEILANLGGFKVIRPEMRESTALGSAIMAGCAIGLYGWDINKLETLNEVNTRGTSEFKPSFDEEVREKMWNGWQRAVERSKGWEDAVDEE